MNDTLYDDGAGDVPPTGGFTEPERRRKPRRQDDVLSAKMEQWVAALLVRRGALLALVSILTYVATATGFRILGPSQDIKDLRADVIRRDSLMNLRVTRLEEGQSQVRTQLGGIEEQLRFLTFLQCAQLHAVKSTLAIDGCPARKPGGF